MASVAIALLVAAVAVVQGQPVAGSLAWGLALAGPGLVFAGVAAVAAQLAESSRTATGITLAALGVAYALRAAGDTSDAGWLTWLSPLGWVEHVEAYGANNWWVLLLFVAAGGLAVAVALQLLVRRDVGGGLFAARLGPATNARLRSPFALAARLQVPSLIGWSVGLLAFGALSGSLADSAESLLDGSSQMTELLEKLGGASQLVDALLGTMGGMAALLVGGYAISAALRMSTEEHAGRLSPLLATAVGRRRWLAGHLVFVLGGPVVLLLVGGLAAGLAARDQQQRQLRTGVRRRAGLDDRAHPRGHGDGRPCGAPVRSPSSADRAGLGIPGGGAAARPTRAAAGAAEVADGPLALHPRRVGARAITAVDGAARVAPGRGRSVRGRRGGVPASGSAGLTRRPCRVDHPLRWLRYHQRARSTAAGDHSPTARVCPQFRHRRTRTVRDRSTLTWCPSTTTSAIRRA